MCISTIADGLHVRSDSDNTGAMTIDSQNNIYFVDGDIFKIDANGNLTTFAATATQWKFVGNSTYQGHFGPIALAHDSEDNIYFIMEGRIRKVDSTGAITTIAGQNSRVGSPRFTGDNGPANQATFSDLSDIVFDFNDNLYIADSGSNRILKIDANGIITTFAGPGTVEVTTGASPATNFTYPKSIAVDSEDNIYILDQFGHIFKADQNGNMSLYKDFPDSFDLVFNAEGYAYVATRTYASNLISQIDPQGLVTSFAGNDGRTLSTGYALGTVLHPADIALDSDENVYVADYGDPHLGAVANNHLRIRKIYSCRCGDGVKDPPEQCDDGNRIDTDACTNSCKLSACGDGIRQSNEQCDDGNKVATDGCTNSCKLPTCGDGIIQGSETCDFGSLNNNNGACTTVCIHAKCGDGYVRDIVESCDDKNNVDNDGCSNSCVLSPVISDVRVSGIAKTSANISWTTHIKSNSSVYYKKQSASSYQGGLSSNTMTLSHSSALSGLSANTSYNFYVCSKATAGIQSCAQVGTFRTARP